MVDKISSLAKIDAHPSHSWRKVMKIKFKKLSDTAVPFAYSRQNDACLDMYADKNWVILPRQTVIVPTGIAVEVPHGYEGIVRGRSGLASKGISVHVGTVDETYRGEVGVIVTNHSYQDFTINKGDRIAQFTVKPVLEVELEEVEELSSTERGTKGYGSSGK